MFFNEVVEILVFNHSAVITLPSFDLTFSLAEVFDFKINFYSLRKSQTMFFLTYLDLLFLKKELNLFYFESFPFLFDFLLYCG